MDMGYKPAFFRTSNGFAFAIYNHDKEGAVRYEIHCSTSDDIIVTLHASEEHRKVILQKMEQFIIDQEK
jgi:hypothetical protein